MIFSGISTLENTNLLFGSYNVLNIRPFSYTDKEFERIALEISLFPPEDKENQF